MIDCYLMIDCSKSIWSKSVITVYWPESATVNLLNPRWGHGAAEVDPVNVGQSWGTPVFLHIHTDGQFRVTK